MKFSDLFWPDSELEKVEIEYDLAKLTLWNDASSKRFTVVCSKLAGIANLCIWEDMTIEECNLNRVTYEDLANTQDGFLYEFYAAHNGIPYFGGKRIEDGITVLSFKLTNGIWFRVYCQQIELEEVTN